MERLAIAMLFVFPFSFAYGQVNHAEVFAQPTSNTFGSVIGGAQERPAVKATLDAYIFSRDGVGGDQPLLLESPYPAPASLTAEELDFSGELGGRFELTIYDQTPNPTDLHFSYLWTGTADNHETRTSSPSDIFFFDIIAAMPADTYTARYFSRFSIGDLGLCRAVTPFLGVSVGLAYGELWESLDLIEQFEPVLSGFYSHTTNDLYGANFGADAQLWSNGRSKIEAGITGGIFYNDIEVSAQSLNWQETWNDSDTAFVGTANIALVVPAHPFNFRIGYQATMLSGMALAPNLSRDLRLHDGGGSVTTDDTVYHGALIGIEWLR